MSKIDIDSSTGTKIPWRIVADATAEADHKCSAAPQILSRAGGMAQMEWCMI